MKVNRAKDVSESYKYDEGLFSDLQEILLANIEEREVKDKREAFNWRSDKEDSNWKWEETYRFRTKAQAWSKAQY